MTRTPRIFNLLPALHRNRDAGTDTGALLALTRVLDAARADVDGDLHRLYRDWFVETCEPGVLPLIGDLVGLAPFERRAYALRAIVADTAAFRARNDSVAAIAERMSALIGWPARLVRGDAPAEIRAEVWPDRPFRFFRAVPRPAAVPGRPGCFHLDALGRDIRLIDEAQSGASPGLPGALTRRSPPEVLARAVPIHVGADGAPPLPPEAVAAGDLGRWSVGAAAPGVRAVIDPVLGRLALLDPPETPDPSAPPPIAVGYTRAAAARSGGGPYERARPRPPTGAWLAHVHGSAVADGPIPDRPVAFPTLRAALEAFAGVPGPGVIRILDSGRYDVADMEVGAPPEACPPDPDARRRLVIEAISGEAPCLTGAVTFRGSGTGLSVTLAGLWLDRGLRLAGRVSASLRHCTVQPDAAWHAQTSATSAALVSISASPVRVALHRCLAGPLHLSGRDRLLIRDSVVDGGRAGRAITGRPAGRLTRSSVIGAAAFRRLESEDTVFDGPVDVADRDAGGCRTSYVAPGSRTPRRTLCAPEAPSIRPIWDSLSWGAAGYARLSLDTDACILAGGSGGREMGWQADIERLKRFGLAEEGLAGYLPPGSRFSLRILDP